MNKSWKDTLNQEERKKLQHLENQITLLKHERYKLQNAASKRISDASKVKNRKKSVPKKKRPARKARPTAATTIDSPAA